MSRYITIEGVEGVGKSYYLEQITSDDRFVVILDDDVDGEALEIIESLRSADIFFRSDDPLKEFEGFSRVDCVLVEEKVLDALHDEKIVLQDRGADSTCLYAALQLAEKGEGPFLSIFRNLFEERKKKCLVSEKVILLLDDVSACIARAEKRNGRKYTADEEEFVRKIDECWRMLAMKSPERYIVIDVEKEDVVDTIKNVLL